jgi:hypothetical protein
MTDVDDQLGLRERCRVDMSDAIGIVAATECAVTSPPLPPGEGG